MPRLPLLLAVMSVAVSLVWWLPKFSMAGNPFDEAILLIYPELVMLGKVLHRDFQAYYGPGNVWMLAGIYQVFGVSISVERIVGLAERIVFLHLLILLAGRLTGRAVVTVILAGLLVLTPLGLMALAWIPAVILSLSGLLVAGRVANRDAADAIVPLPSLAGGLMALSLLFRPDAGPAVLLASGIFLLGWTGRQRRQWLTGFLLGNVPMLIHLLTATPRAVWNNLLYYPLFIVKDGRLIPWADVKPIIQPLIWLYLALAFANVLTGILLWRRDKASPPLFLAVSLLGVGLAHQVFQRCDLAHLAMGSLITFPLGAITAHIWLERWWPARSRWLTGPAGLVLCGSIFFAVAPDYGRQIALPQLREVVAEEAVPANSVVSGSRSYPIAPPVAQFHAMKVTEYISSRSQAGDKIFVGPGDLRRTFYGDLYFYYLLMPRMMPSGYFMELNPLLTNSETSGIEQQILGSEWVLLNQIYDHYYENNRSSELGSEKPGKVLKAHFQEVFRSGPFLVYRKVSVTAPPAAN